MSDDEMVFVWRDCGSLMGWWFWTVDPQRVYPYGCTLTRRGAVRQARRYLRRRRRREASGWRVGPA